MSKSARNLRIVEIKSLLSNYVGSKQCCNDLVDKVFEISNGMKGDDFDRKAGVSVKWTDVCDSL